MGGGGGGAGIPLPSLSSVLVLRAGGRGGSEATFDSEYGWGKSLDLPSCRLCLCLPGCLKLLLPALRLSQGLGASV